MRIHMRLWKRQAHIRINRIYQCADYAHIENLCAYAENRSRMANSNSDPPGEQDQEEPLSH